VFNSVFQNDEFHQIIEELVTWLEKTENVIRQAEPVDLTDKLEVIEAKYTKFRVSSSIRILYKAVFICILNTCSSQYLKHKSFFPPVFWVDIPKFLFLFEAVELTLLIMLTGTEK
jgi:sulfur relay (sulfurtransferase) DsrC/TusE family protein